MTIVLTDDWFAPEVILDPYSYFGALRHLDPIHWNERYELWVFTRYRDVVSIARHPELFSSRNREMDTRPPYPAVDADGLQAYERVVRPRTLSRFIEFDRPAHLAM